MSIYILTVGAELLIGINYMYQSANLSDILFIQP